MAQVSPILDLPKLPKEVAIPDVCFAERRRPSHGVSGCGVQVNRKSRGTCGGVLSVGCYEKLAADSVDALRIEETGESEGEAGCGGGCGRILKY